MMYSSGITGALGFLGLRVRVVGACASRTPGIQLAFISLYSPETLARPSWQEAASLKGRSLLVPHSGCTSCRVAEVPRAALLAEVAV